MNVLRYVSILLLGIAGGVGAMLCLDRLDAGGREREPATPVLAPVPTTAPSSPVATPVREPSARTPAANDASPSKGDEGLISRALAEYAREQLRAGWRSSRAEEIPAERLDEGMKQFEASVKSAPGAIGRSLGDRETKMERALEDARTGGAFALLASLRKGGAGPVVPIASERDRLRELLQRNSSESFVSGYGHKGHVDKLLADGVTLSFPAGVFRLDNPFSSVSSPPRDVTIAGAGMDATLLVLNGDISARAELRRFALRDCTVHTNSHYLFDQRTGGVTVLMERVRVIGFDMGAGSSCVMSFNDGAVLQATDCRFEGGYGRAPRFGTLFDVRTDALVARFDRCTLSLASLMTPIIRPGATIVFSSCSLVNMLDDPMAGLATHPGIVFGDTSVSRFDKSSGPVPQLDLNVLFPDWKSRIE
jgi:hypothetical protein